MPTEEEKAAQKAANKAKLQHAAGLCRDYGEGTLTFEGTFSLLETIFDLEPNPFEQEKVRRLVEANPEDGPYTLLKGFLSYHEKVLETRNEVHRSNIEQHKLTLDMGAENISLSKGTMAFVEYAIEKSPELATPLISILQEYSTELHEKFFEEVAKHEEEAKKNANRIQADSFEGVSEAMPDTIEELLGEVENK